MSQPESIVPVLEPETPPAPEPTPEVTPDPTPEPEPRTVPLQALHEERTRRQSLEGEVRSLRDTITAFQPIGERLRSRPALLAQLMADEQPPADDGPTISDTEAREIAIELALYTPQNEPNLDAARRYHGRAMKHAAKIAESIVEKAVGPVRQQTTHSLAKGRRDEALQAARQLEIPEAEIAPILDDILAKNPDIFANPETAPLALVAALGYLSTKQRVDALQKVGKLPRNGQPAPTPIETPVFTEAPGRRPAASGLTEAEARLAKTVGVKEDTWQKANAALTKMQATGRSVPLED